MSTINHSLQLAELLQSAKYKFSTSSDKKLSEKHLTESNHHELQAFSDPEFVCFFLNYLRETSTAVLKKSATHCSKNENSELSNRNIGMLQQAQVSSGAQMMSTPKFRDDIATPKSCHNFSSSSMNYSCRTPASGKVFPKSASLYDGNSASQYDRYKHTNSSQKYCSKPLSLSDFLSPEAGHASNHSSTKKLSQKQRSQNKKRITPVSEGRSQYSANDSYISQYKNEVYQSSFTEKNNGTMRPDIKRLINPLFSEASRSISFDIEEDFPSLSVASTRNLQSKPTRRIKPTTLSNSTDKICSEKEFEKSPFITKKSCFKEEDSNSQNPFMSALPVNSAPSSSLSEERHILLEMKKKINKQPVEEDKILKTSVKILDDISPVKRISTEPNPLHVFDAWKIERLAQLYSYLINAFLVPNIITELQFIVDLLTVLASTEKQESSGLMCITGSLCNSSESNNDDSSENTTLNTILLSTAANCVLFAVHTVQSLVHSGIISVLSRSTLSLLSQSSRIQHFMPALPAQIFSLVEQLEQKERDLSAECFGSQEKTHYLSSVPFQAETDDRSNFHSDRSFHAFRKHRDLFYAIIREYEDKKNDSNFDIQQHFGGKMKNLVSQVKSTATYKPFVRLFVSQMLQGGNLIETISQASSFVDASFNDGNISRTDLLTSLRHGDPEKFRRLQSRFVTASTPSADASKLRDPISDQCYFFKEFIICADSFVLNVHLCNELRERISDIETQQVQQILDDALAETVNIATVAVSLSNIVSSLRVLGRFFGLVTFLPYHPDECSETPLDQNILKNLSHALDTASSNRHNLVTIPWVTEYLKSGNFSSSSSFKEVKEVIEKLFLVYRHHAYDRKKFSSGDFMLSLAVSTLLESQIFPEDCFYDVFKKYPRIDYARNALNFDLKTKQHNKQEGEMSSISSLDQCCMDLINLTIIYEWYPRLKDIRSDIISSISGSAKSNDSQQPPRKIKPNTEKKADESISKKREKQLQLNLEEFFFRGQPSSLKRTVAFVAERCASNCVKHVRSISMLNVCDEAENIFRQRLHEKMQIQEIENFVKVNLIRQVTSEMKQIAKNRMNEESKFFCEKAVTQCMENLTSCETADGVLKIAIQIAKKRAIANVYCWLSSRLDELVSVSVKARLTKVSSNMTAIESPVLVQTEQVGVAELTSNNMKIESLSTLLQIMKEYILKFTFSSNPKTHSCYFKPVGIDPSISDTISEKDVSFLLSFSRSILNKDNEEIINISNKETINSMKNLIILSPHLRNAIMLTTKELASRAGSYFTGPCSQVSHPSISSNPQFSNVQSTCT